MRGPRSFAAALVASVFAVAALPAHADSAKCEKTVSKQMAKLAKKQLQLVNKCLDKENVGKLEGPCPDLNTGAKLAKLSEAVGAKIAKDCSMADLAELGFAGNCELETATEGVEAGCFALPVTTPLEFASCLQCWQSAEISELVATLYASHAHEVCGGDLTEMSPVCSDLEFNSPLPDQRNLGAGGESDCQKMIGLGGFKYFLLRHKALANCALRGNSQAQCLLDPVVDLKLQKSATKLDTLVDKKCANREPVASAPFCCRSGGGNMCVAATSREDCTDVHGGQVQEGKICDVDNTCTNPPGNTKGITWWELCPDQGAALSDIDDVKACIQTAAGTIIDEILCWTFPGGGGTEWPCPAGG